MEYLFYLGAVILIAGFLVLGYGMNMYTKDRIKWDQQKIPEPYYIIGSGIILILISFVLLFIWFFRNDFFNIPQYFKIIHTDDESVAQDKITGKTMHETELEVEDIDEPLKEDIDEPLKEDTDVGTAQDLLNLQHGSPEPVYYDSDSDYEKPRFKKIEYPTFQQTMEDYVEDE